MKVKELIEQLNQIENKERELQILIGDESNDSLSCETFELMHTDDCEQCVEIFCVIDDCYTDEMFPNTRIEIKKSRKMTAKEIVDDQVNESFEFIFDELKDMFELSSGDISPNQVQRLEKFQDDLSDLVLEWVEQNSPEKHTI